MDVTSGGMRVEMHERRPLSRVRDLQPGLLNRLAHRCLGGRFSRVDMATGLEPSAKTAVAVEHGPPRAGHDSRRRHVDRIRLAVEGTHQPVELGEHARLRRALASVVRVVRLDERAQVRRIRRPGQRACRRGLEGPG